MRLPLFAFGTAVFLLWGVYAHNAHAYLDPGTGSYLLQILAAFIVGGLFAVKMFWRRIIAFLKSRFSKSQQ